MRAEEVRHFKCPQHPKYVLDVVCKFRSCTRPTKFLCGKCFLLHSSCEREVVSLEEFLDKLDTLKLQQVGTQDRNYLAEVSRMEL